jgi:uncharacterized membrane-anchored protein YhcB (DUF1043 family)
MSIVKEAELMLYENVNTQQKIEHNLDIVRYEKLLISLENYSEKLEQLITTTCNIENNLTKGYRYITWKIQ